ncbi:hypothetical protein DYB32_005659 [Aphanomyces invadans]|uniref:Helicase C-terminal domain-containing protein n=1 Tax=Aphanomyces invadans TaxID=157072 RepID=A0A418AWJ7_9STRA|nr:hypothetical protein DYB32_005659 [Aphanomyces invadans]
MVTTSQRRSSRLAPSQAAPEPNIRAPRKRKQAAPATASAPKKQRAQGAVLDKQHERPSNASVKAKSPALRRSTRTTGPLVEVVNSMVEETDEEDDSTHMDTAVGGSDDGVDDSNEVTVAPQSRAARVPKNAKVTRVESTASSLPSRRSQPTRVKTEPKEEQSIKTSPRLRTSANNITVKKESGSDNSSDDFVDSKDVKKLKMTPTKTVKPVARLNADGDLASSESDDIGLSKGRRAKRSSMKPVVASSTRGKRAVTAKGKRKQMKDAAVELDSDDDDSSDFVAGSSSSDDDQVTNWAAALKSKAARGKDLIEESSSSSSSDDDNAPLKPKKKAQPPSKPKQPGAGKRVKKDGDEGSSPDERVRAPLWRASGVEDERVALGDDAFIKRDVLPAGKPSMHLTAALLPYQQEGLAEIERFVEANHLTILVYHGPKRSNLTTHLASYDVVLTTYSILESEGRKLMEAEKVACAYCGKLFVPEKLVPHNKYFCGPDSMKTAKQMKQQKVKTTKKVKKLNDSDNSENSSDEDIAPIKRSVPPPKKPKKTVKQARSPLHEVEWTRIILDEAHYIKVRLNPGTHGSSVLPSWLQDKKCSTARSVFRLKSLYKWCLSGVLLRRTKESRADDISLPPKLVRVRRDALDEREKDFYEVISPPGDMPEDHEQVPVKESRARHIGKSSLLRRLPNLGDFQSSTKIEALMEELHLMREDDPSAKAIVFSQFVNMLDLIEHRLHLAGMKCAKLSGGMPMAHRDRLLTEFREDPALTVFLISLKAGGVALNLTVASQYVLDTCAGQLTERCACSIFLMDPWWNPAAEHQAIDRTHRLGQFKPIRATRFVIANTIEERILKLQEKKQLVFEGTVGSSTAALARLTIEDLRFLFSG